MIDTQGFDAPAYVAAVAPAIGLTLDAQAHRAVAEALMLVARIAAPALSVVPPANLEPAPIFTP